MSEEKLRILDLFKEGKISAAETLELLGALDEIAGTGEAVKTDMDTPMIKTAAPAGPNSSGQPNCHHLEMTLIGGGDITVSGWEGNEMVIDQPRTARPFQKNLCKWTGDHYKIYALGGTDYEVKVPFTWDLTIYTAGGDIDIRDISGQISGKTLGGDIAISRFKGCLNLNTAGGDIKLQDCDADGAVHTLGGDVIFRNVSGNVSGTTLGGEMIRS
jgi:hypothetical protein